MSRPSVQKIVSQKNFKMAKFLAAPFLFHDMSLANLVVFYFVFFFLNRYFQLGRMFALWSLIFIFLLNRTEHHPFMVNSRFMTFFFYVFNRSMKKRRAIDRLTDWTWSPLQRSALAGVIAGVLEYRYWLRYSRYFFSILHSLLYSTPKCRYSTRY